MGTSAEPWAQLDGFPPPRVQQHEGQETAEGLTPGSDHGLRLPSCVTGADCAVSEQSPPLGCHCPRATEKQSQGLQWASGPGTSGDVKGDPEHGVCGFRSRTAAGGQSPQEGQVGRRAGDSSAGGGRELQEAAPPSSSQTACWVGGPWSGGCQAALSAHVLACSLGLKGSTRL